MPPVSPTPRAQPLGLRKSFGYGDRLGLGTTGHLLAARRYGFASVFAQATIRDLERFRRPPEDVIRTTHAALTQAGYRGAWGADMGGIKTESDVDRTLAAGFSWFSLDPSAFIEPRADQLSGIALDKAIAEVVNEGVLPANWAEPYRENRFEVAPGLVLRFTRDDLHRAAVKLSRAIQHSQRLGRRLAHQAFSDQWEIEVSLTGANTPTTPLEHLFVALEFKRRGTPIIALAPRLAFALEPGVDARDAPSVLEDELAAHAAIARACGPYKLSLPDIGDHDSILPVIGRVCADRLHVKTSGISHLEALRVVCRASPELFREIAKFAHSRFVDDRELAGVSTTLPDLEPLFKNAGQLSLENAFLGTPAGRQLLLATSMSLLTTDTRYRGRTLYEAIAAYVTEDATLYGQLLDAAYTRHLSLLNAG